MCSLAPNVAPVYLGDCILGRDLHSVSIVLTDYVKGKAIEIMPKLNCWYKTSHSHRLFNIADRGRTRFKAGCWSQSILDSAKVPSFYSEGDELLEQSLWE